METSQSTVQVRTPLYSLLLALDFSLGFLETPAKHKLALGWRDDLPYI